MSPQRRSLPSPAVGTIDRLDLTHDGSGDRAGERGIPMVLLEGKSRDEQLIVIPVAQKTLRDTSI
jgi:hypothetical protein